MSDTTIRSCIEACLACFVECERCSSACIDHGSMAACVKACRDCADLCSLCVSFMARGSSLHHELCKLCAAACQKCAEECGKHAAHHACCKACEEACRKCAEPVWRAVNHPAAKRSASRRRLARLLSAATGVPPVALISQNYDLTPGPVPAQPP